MRVHFFEKIANLPLYDRHLGLLRNSVYGLGALCHLMLIVQSIVFIVALCFLPINKDSFYVGPIGAITFVFLTFSILGSILASILSGLFLWKTKESKLCSVLTQLWLGSHFLFLSVSIIASIVIQIGLNHG